MPVSSLHHAKSSGSSLFAVLSLSTLESLDQNKINALKSINIRLIGDLLNFKPISIHAQVLMAVSRREVGHEIDLEYHLKNSYLNTLIPDLPDLPLIAIEGIGSSTEQVFNNDFGVTTVRELSVFPPYIEALSYLTPDDEVFNEPASAPRDLMPKIIGSTHSIARFSNYIRSTKIETTGQLKKSGDAEVYASQEILDLFHHNNFSCYLGYIAGFKQSWVNMGTHLGEIIYSLALAPGEQKRVAFKDWRRKQRSSRDEDTGVDEFLSNTFLHTRALNEVVKTTAQEHLSGNTEIDSTTKTTGYGLTAGIGGGSSIGASGSSASNTSASADLTDIIGLPIGLSSGNSSNLSGAMLNSVAGSVGGSAVHSKSQQQGTLKSESSGFREILGEVQQDITDSTVQNSANFRSLHSTIITTDEQTESQEIRTSIVTNYNHSHALTTHYFEVLHRYNIECKLDNWGLVLYIPFNPIVFNIELIKKYWSILRVPIFQKLPGLFELYDLAIKGYEATNPNFVLNANTTVNEIRVIPSGSSDTYIHSSVGPLQITKEILNIQHDINLIILDGQSDEIISSRYGNGTKTHNPSSNLLSDFGVIQLEYDKASQGILQTPINSTDSAQIRFTLEIKLKDTNGNTLTVNKSFIKIIIFSDIYDMHINDTKVILHNNFSAEVINSIQANGNLTSLDLINDIEDHFNRFKYGYTRYIINALEKEQLIDVIESLCIQDGVDELLLTDFIYPSPVAITENLLVFKVKEICETSATPKTQVTGEGKSIPFTSSGGTIQNKNIDFHGNTIITPPDSSGEINYSIKADSMTIHSSGGGTIGGGSTGGTAFGSGTITLNFEYDSNIISGNNIIGEMLITYTPFPLTTTYIDEYTIEGNLKDTIQGTIELSLSIVNKTTGITKQNVIIIFKLVAKEFNSFKDNLCDNITRINSKLTDYIKDRTTSVKDTVFLPTAGVFAESILGRSNASEFVNPRRFWNWQDSPIPHLAPEIAEITAGNHTVTDPSSNLTPTVPTSNLNIINPPQYPLPTSLNSALGAIQNGNMFRDMSKSGDLVSIMGKLADLANNSAQLAGNLSGQAAANALNAAIELGSQVAGMVNNASNNATNGLATPPSSPTDKAAALNLLSEFSDPSNLTNSEEAMAGIMGASLNNNGDNGSNSQNTDNNSNLNNQSGSSSSGPINESNHDDSYVLPSLELMNQLSDTKDPSWCDYSIGFPVNVYEISNDDKEGIQSGLIPFFQNNPNIEIKAIIGRASQTGPSEYYNLQLSYWRANSVFNLLKGQIPQWNSIPYVLGFGSSKPFYDHDGVEIDANRTATIRYKKPIQPFNAVAPNQAGSSSWEINLEFTKNIKANWPLTKGTISLELPGFKGVLTDLENNISKNFVIRFPYNPLTDGSVGTTFGTGIINPPITKQFDTTIKIDINDFNNQGVFLIGFSAKLLWNTSYFWFVFKNIDGDVSASDLAGTFTSFGLSPTNSVPAIYNDKAGFKHDGLLPMPQRFFSILDQHGILEFI